MCRVNYLSTDSKAYTLLTSVHNDADNAEDADDVDDYNRVIGIAQLKAFSCANKEGKCSTMTEHKHTHLPNTQFWHTDFNLSMDQSQQRLKLQR